MNYSDLKINIDDLSNKKRELIKNGFLLIENALSSEYCESMINFIDRKLDDDKTDYESGHCGTMQRIWYAENHFEIAQDYKEKCAHILTNIIGSPSSPQKILAMRDKAKEFLSTEEFLKFSQGRWHYDSWVDQYKIFLFLEDVNEENGPFEFIPETNGKFKKMLLLKPGWIFNPFTHFFTKTRPYQSISDKKIQSLFDKGFKSKPILAKKGTIMIVNPSALIHRARPIQQGRRYLAVAYF